jgi:mRNA interferase RelE/StbE
MKIYEIEIDDAAYKFLLSQPKPQQIRVLAGIYRLPDSGDIKKLKGRIDTYRLRIGNYRILYKIDDAERLITVIRVGVRGSVYMR